MNNTIHVFLDAGKAQSTQGESLNTFLASLTTSGIIFVGGVLAYVYLRCRFPKYYTCREFRWSWKLALLSPRWLFLPPPDPSFQQTSEIDNYFFDRYLHTVTRIFSLVGLIALPILIPLNVVGGRNAAGGVNGLDRLSFSNVGLSHTDRYWAHLTVALYTIFSTCYIIRGEIRDYNRVQSKVASPTASSETSLLLIIKPTEPLDLRSVWRHFHEAAGGVLAVEQNRDFRSLRAKIREREAAIKRLEIAETDLIRKANSRSKQRQGTIRSQYDGMKPLWMKYLSPADRPRVRLPLCPRLPSVPLIGPQADAIYHARAEVARYNLEIQCDQRCPENFPLANSVFIYFNHKIPTSLATLALTAGLPPSWTLKQGTSPNDTIWENVTISWWQQCMQTFAVYLLSALLILVFAFPISITGSLSQLDYLVNVRPWIKPLPQWLVAAIQGILPPVLLSAVTVIVPVALRRLANMQGLHSRQAVENNLQVYYFVFLFIQVFLAVSLSAGITAIIGEFSESIKAVPVVLAQNLPKACNYFFSYIMIYTFTTISFTLVQIGKFVHLAILSPILDRIAREKWMRKDSVGLQKWGTFLPVFTNLACIGIIYSIIAPLILVCNIVCFGAFGILYRYYPPKLTGGVLTSGGQFYPTAIRQLFTGVYFLELCLAGLFLLVRDANNRATCVPHAVIMVITGVITILFQYALHNDLWRSLPPLQLLAKKKELPVKTPNVFHGSQAQDEALKASCPVVWLPKDELGISNDEITNVKRTHKHIWISNEGAFLDGNGKLELCDTPPVMTQNAG